MKHLVIILLLLQPAIFLANNPEWIVFDNTNSPIPASFGSLLFDITISNSTDIYMSSDKHMLKFNYSNWTIYDQKNIPQLNRLREIVAYKSDNLWLINRWDGIIKYNIQNSEIIKYDTTNSPIKYNEITSFCIDSNNVKWFINYCQDGGIRRLLYRWEGDEWTIYDSSTLSIKYNWGFQKIFVDSKNNKWFAYPALIVKYDNENWVDFDSVGDDENICSFAEDSSNNIWFGKETLWKYNGTLWKKDNENIPFFDISSIAVDNENNLWFSAKINTAGERYYRLIKYKNGNYFILDSSNSPIKPDGHSGHDIYKIIIDKFGNKLIAGSQGLIVFREGGVVGITDVADDIKMEKDKILCYPNPSEGNITIRYRIEKYSEVNLYISDILGNRIELRKENKFPGDYIEEYNLSDLANGIYFATVNNGTVIYSKQFVIMR